VGGVDGAVVMSDPIPRGRAEEAVARVDFGPPRRLLAEAQGAQESPSIF